MNGKTMGLAGLAAILLAAGGAVGSSSTVELSEARCYLSATSAGGMAFFGGGWNGGGASSVVDIFDATGTRLPSTNLSQARYWLAATSAGGNVFFGGGEVSEFAPVDRVDVYNTATGAWTRTALSEARNSLAATSAGGNVFFGGGILDNNATMSKAVDIFDASGSLLRTVQLSQARSGLSAASARGLAFFAGGTYHDAYGTPWIASDRVDIYNGITGDFLRTEYLPGGARGGMAATSCGDLVFFGGGWSGGTGNEPMCDAVDIYDAKNGRWLPAPPLSQARGGLAAASAGDLVFFGGGAPEAGNYFSDVVDIYDGITGAFLRTEHLSQARFGLEGTSVCDQVFFGGGYPPPGNGIPTDRVDIYTIPEPGTVSLLALGGLAMIRRRNKAH